MPGLNGFDAETCRRDPVPWPDAQRYPIYVSESYFGRQTGMRSYASSPLVPRNDPTLMFANSGMVQFKNLFTGS